MELKDVQEDQFVTDAKFRKWGVGVVRKVLKERAYVYFKDVDRTIVYGENNINAINLRTGRPTR